MNPINVARNIRRPDLRWPSEQINGLAFTLGIIDRALRLLRGEQIDFKFLPRPARKKLEQIHDFKQSAPDHQTPEGNPPFPDLGQNHAAMPWTH